MLLDAGNPPQEFNSLVAPNPNLLRGVIPCLYKSDVRHITTLRSADFHFRKYTHILP